MRFSCFIYAQCSFAVSLPDRQRLVRCRLPSDMGLGTNVQVTGEQAGSTILKEVWCDLFAV